MTAPNIGGYMNTKYMLIYPLKFELYDLEMTMGICTTCIQKFTKQNQNQGETTYKVFIIDVLSIIKILSNSELNIFSHK